MLRYDRLFIVSGRSIIRTPGSSSNILVTVWREKPVSSATSATDRVGLSGDNGVVVVWGTGGWVSIRDMEANTQRSMATLIIPVEKPGFRTSDIFRPAHWPRQGCLSTGNANVFPEVKPRAQALDQRQPFSVGRNAAKSASADATAAKSAAIWA